MTRHGDPLKCSFCGKTHTQVLKLIAGPGVYICDQCISLCNEIIVQEIGSEASDAEVEAAAKDARDAVERLRLLARRGADRGPG